MARKATTQQAQEAQPENGATLTTASGPTKVNLFAKAKTKAAQVPGGTKRKETVWRLGEAEPSDPSTQQLEEAIHQVIELHAKSKTIETQSKLYKHMVQDYAYDHYVDALVTTGQEPPTPLKVANSKGESLTYVVQDRGALTKVDDSQYEMLVQAVGEDVAKQCVWTGGEFKFNQAVLSQDGIFETVTEAISEVVGKLLEKGKLTQAQAENLLSYEEERRLKPGLVADAVLHAGRNRERLERFHEALGSGLVTYAKP